jgi:clan AA aspartic protease
VTGTVDHSGRALLRIRVRYPVSGAETELDAWIDTGFTGELVLPAQQVTRLGLPLGPAVRAGLADGSEVELDTHTCIVDWFGESKRIEAVSNRGQFPLLGVGRLLDRELSIDYRARTLSIS